MDGRVNQRCDPGTRPVEQVCPSCQRRFVCEIALGRQQCWCMQLPAALPVCENAKCLCRDCLQQAIEALQGSQTPTS